MATTRRRANSNPEHYGSRFSGRRAGFYAVRLDPVAEISKFELETIVTHSEHKRELASDRDELESELGRLTIFDSDPLDSSTNETSPESPGITAMNDDLDNLAPPNSPTGMGTLDGIRRRNSKVVRFSLGCREDVDDATNEDQPQWRRQSLPTSLNAHLHEQVQQYDEIRTDNKSTEQQDTTIQTTGNHGTAANGPGKPTPSSPRPALKRRPTRDRSLGEIMEPRQKLLITLAEALAGCGAKPQAIDLVVNSLAEHLKLPIAGIYILPRQKHTMKIVFKDPDSSHIGSSHPASQPTRRRSNSESSAIGAFTGLGAGSLYMAGISHASMRFSCNCSAHTVQCLPSKFLDKRKLRVVYDIYRDACTDVLNVAQAQAALTRLLYDQWDAVRMSTEGGLASGLARRRGSLVDAVKGIFGKSV